MANPLRVVDGLAVTTGDVVTDSGDVTATAGAIEAGTTVAAGTTLTAGTGITATTGDVLVSTGDISVTLGSVTADEGNITATLGDITASAGAVAGTTISADGTQVLPQEGAYPSAVFLFTTWPAEDETIMIGATTYTFKAAPGGAGSLQIGRDGASVENSRDFLLNYINNSVDFVEDLVASAISTNYVKLTGATGAAGSRVAAVGVANVALADSGAAAIVTNQDDSNVTGKVAGGSMTGGEFVVSAKAATAIAVPGAVLIELPFTPTWFQVSMWTSAGEILSTTKAITDVVAINGDAIMITGTGAVHLAATDVVRWIAGT